MALVVRGIVRGIFYFNLIPAYAGLYVWASWTIGVEMIFYAIFPFLYFRVGSLTKKLTACLVLMFIYSCFLTLAPYWIDEPLRQRYVESFTVLRHLPNFVFGMIAFNIWQANHRQGERGAISA